MEYTKGEWIIFEPAERDWGNYQIAGEGGRQNIALLPADWLNAEANARLIAQSPRMYEALQEIAEGTGAYSLDPLTHCGNTVENMKRIASEALAKAEGKDTE